MNLKDRFSLAIDLNDFSASHTVGVENRNGVFVAFSGFLSDVEAGTHHDVLRKAHRRDGVQLSKNLLGQYCGCLVDPSALQAILFQDSLGVRDLYYALRGTRLFVSSDLDLLLSVTGVPELDETFFAHFLGDVSQDRRITPYKDVRQLSYGETLLVSPSGTEAMRPWQPASADWQGSAQEAEEELRRLLDQAVARCLPDAGTVACELTGGLDSSSVFTAAHPMTDSLHALTYVADRGMAGDDDLFAAEVLAAAPAPWTKLDLDTSEIVPESYGSFIAEPRALLYSYQFDAMRCVLQGIDASVLLTGCVGDVIFEFGGITPAFLADPLYAFSPLQAYRQLRDWAHARRGTRSWLHYLRTTAWPVAAARHRGLSVLDWDPNQPSSWISADLCKRHGLNGRLHRPVCSPMEKPSQQHLWESVYELAAFENSPAYRALGTPMRHPLYDRELVCFLLSLDWRVRRGIDGDRRLQRRALGARLPETVRTRRSKGSAQELRERHIMESARWYEYMTQSPRIVERGWVDMQLWLDEVEKARVGASRFTPGFTNAIQTELWLRALERHPTPEALVSANGL